MEDALEAIGCQHDQLACLFGQVSDSDTDHRRALAELVKHMAAHVSVEQGVLWPVVKRTGSGGKHLSRVLRQHYHRIEKLLVLIERRKVDSPDLPALVTELRDTFTSHAETWASAVHPKLATSLSAQEMQDLAARVAAAEDTILSHPHPHLLSLGPLSRLTTRIASRFDRARDRTVSNQP
jgi:hemoglobin-like flavoprotein